MYTIIVPTPPQPTTQLIQWLLQRIRVSQFTPNKQEAAELLAVLVQSSPINQRIVGQQAYLDGVLEAVAPYKSRCVGFCGGCCFSGTHNPRLLLSYTFPIINHAPHIASTINHPHYISPPTATAPTGIQQQRWRRSL